MAPTLRKARTGGHKQGKTDVTFKGVRMRTWGMWVSEIRKPMTKERIWLGSYDSPEKAARAYDAALYCLRGSKGQFNFPDEKRPEVPEGSSSSLSTPEIKEVAARFASPKCRSVRSSASSLATAKPPEVESSGTEGTVTSEIGDSPFEAGVKENDPFFSGSYLDVPITHEPDSIWALLDEFKGFSEGN